MLHETKIKGHTVEFGNAKECHAACDDGGYPREVFAFHADGSKTCVRRELKMPGGLHFPEFNKSVILNRGAR